MNICSLKLRNFRNYDMAECVFRPNSICILEGKNAQGKTNLIESIYYLSHLRSFRTPSSSSLILENQDFFMIQAQIESHQRKEDLKSYLWIMRSIYIILMIPFEDILIL